MFTNDKHSRDLCPTALDTDLYLASHPYIWTKVLPQAPQWSLSHLGFNSPWTLLNYFPSTVRVSTWVFLQSSAEGSWWWDVKSLLTLSPDESQELHSHTSCISRNAVGDVETRTLLFAKVKKLWDVRILTEFYGQMGACSREGAILEHFRLLSSDSQPEELIQLYALCW